VKKHPITLQLDACDVATLLEALDVLSYSPACEDRAHRMRMDLAPSGAGEHGARVNWDAIAPLMDAIRNGFEQAYRPEADERARRWWQWFDGVRDSQPADVREAFEAAGCHVWHTGGGCLAYGFNATTDKLEVVVTDGNLGLPESLDGLVVKI
jgi:hypothetical protein